MTAFFARGFGAALVCLITSSAAMADLKAQDVWSDWRAYLSGTGYEITASEQMNGDTLVVSDVSMVMAAQDPASTVTINMDRIEFVEGSDGTIAVTLPANLPIRFAGTDDDGATFDALLTYSQTGQTLVASGVPEKMTYNYSAARVELSLTSLTVDGESISSQNARANIAFDNVVNTTQMQLTDLRSYSQKMLADTLAYDMAFADPESEDSASLAGSMTGFAFEGDVSVPNEMDTTNFQNMLQAGFAFDGTFEFATGQSELSGQGEGESFSAASASNGGSAQVAMNAQSLTYDITQTDASLTVSTAEIPFPVTLEMARAAFRMVMPVGKSDEEQDFEMAFTLADFAVPDMIWGMFDPSGVLPHEPATITLDLAGKAKVLFDFLDPNVAETLENSETPPGELNALTIRELLVSAVGANLSGSGDFTFDNSDLASFGGMPAPRGAIDLKLVGANGLLDNLIQMGFVSDQDAMGARMMMGMLAVPGDGEDTLNSKIEFNDQGHILANGQRIQ